MKVLLVDDHVELAENLAEILEVAGVSCEVVDSAEAALLRLAAEDFQGLITDFRLPGSSGLHLIERVRAEGWSLPIVLLSAFATEAVVEQAEAAGALVVLPKPVDVARLTELLAAFEKPAREVLLIEDDLDLSENLRELLTREGYVVQTSPSVARSLKQRRLPRLAVVDVRLPDGTGLEVARRLFARDPSIQLLMMSGHLDAAALQELSALPGAVMPPLVKPVAPAELVHRIEEALNG